MKKIVSLVLVLLVVVSLTACGGAKNNGNIIPDVFGISYTDAIEILEADGYEVKAVETSVDSISEKLLYPLEKVGKGNVFKIDDYILDDLGHINKNYDVSYDGELISEDKSVVIYYAIEDYALEEETTSDENISATESTTESKKSEVTKTEQKKESVDDSGIDPDFKKAMDSYEDFMDEYVEFMKKYNSNPSDLTLLNDYATYLSEYSEFVEDFEKWEDEDLNTEEAAYYLDVQTRVTKKLLEITE